MKNAELNINGINRLNIKNWMVLSTTIFTVVLTILALIWQAPPSEALYSVSLLFMVSFILFLNSITANSRSNYEVGKEEININLVKKLIKYAEHCFGIGLSLVINGIAILSYKYMSDYIGVNLLTLLLPIFFISTALICMSIYKRITENGKEKKRFRVRFKRQIWAILEITALIIIGLDYLNLITIP